MAYSETLAERIRQILKGKRKISEKKMFGGLCFLAADHMCCGVVGETLMLRVGPEQYEDLLKEKHAREMDFTGKPMKGILYVTPQGIKTKAQLKFWLERGLAFVKTLPPKKKR